MFLNSIHLVTFLGFGTGIASQLRGRGIYLSPPCRKFTSCADSRRANVLVYYNWFGISDGWHDLAAEALAVAAILKILPHRLSTRSIRN
jgi:hypothetical protein